MYKTPHIQSSSHLVSSLIYVFNLESSIWYSRGYLIFSCLSAYKCGKPLLHTLMAGTSDLVLVVAQKLSAISLRLCSNELLAIFLRT